MARRSAKRLAAKHPPALNRALPEGAPQPRRMRVLRIADGHSLQQVANVTGLSPDFIAKLERGDAPMSLRAGRELSKFYGLPVSELVGPCGEPQLERLGPFIEMVAELVAERVLMQLKKEDGVSS